MIPIEAALSVPVDVKEDIPAEITIIPIIKVTNDTNMELMIYDVMIAAITLGRNFLFLASDQEALLPLILIIDIHIIEDEDPRYSSTNKTMNTIINRIEIIVTPPYAEDWRTYDIIAYPTGTLKNSRKGTIIHVL